MEPFCCLSAEDPGDACGTCYPSAVGYADNWCGVSAGRCVSCSATWCGPPDSTTDGGAPASCAARSCPGAYEPDLPCQCNERCVHYQNCCADFHAACGPPPAEGAADEGQGVEEASCASLGCADFRPGEACQCNDRCAEFGDCCPDFTAACGAGASEGSVIIRNGLGATAPLLRRHGRSATARVVGGLAAAGAAALAAALAATLVRRAARAASMYEPLPAGALATPAHAWLARAPAAARRGGCGEA